MVTTKKTGGGTAADIAALERHEVIGGVVHEKASPTAEHGSAQFALSHFLFHAAAAGRAAGGS